MRAEVEQQGVEAGADERRGVRHQLAVVAGPGRVAAVGNDDHAVAPRGGEEPAAQWNAVAGAGERHILVRQIEDRG